MWRRRLFCVLLCVVCGAWVLVCSCACERACMCVCVCVCVRASVRARTRMRVCAHEQVPLAHEVRTGASLWICRQSHLLQHHEPARNGPCPFANKCLAGDPAGGALHPFAVASIHCAAGGPPPVHSDVAGVYGLEPCAPRHSHTQNERKCAQLRRNARSNVQAHARSGIPAHRCRK